ncbi:MAG: CoA transferase [Sphingorhabdus sp.]
MIASQETEKPLSGISVVEIVDSALAGIGRSLAELGAEVVSVEITDRAAVPAEAPMTRERVEYVARNLGKRIESISLENDGARLAHLLASADLIIEDVSIDPRYASAFDFDALRRDAPSLVILTATLFGSGNSYSGWQATDPVLHALSGELARSGIKGREPVLPPGELSLQCAIAQASYAAALAIYHALATGCGDHLDFSALDGAVQSLDPGYGIGGSATMGRAAKLQGPDRPVKGFQYPILPCADGHVRICVLAPRQWLGMFKWIGEPAEFASEEFLKTTVRFKSPDLNPAIARFFADKSRAELEREGQAHGVPIAALLSLDECLDTEHVKVRNAFVEASVALGVVAPFPNGTVEIDGQRMGPAQPNRYPKIATTARPLSRPLEGIKVLDLGVIVVGAEQGRLLADMGADVIKLESTAFPDGSRQSDGPIGLSAGFAAGHRNKRSLGLNLKSDEGKAIFRQLVGEADVVLSNFKPGTMDALGFSRAALEEINPSIITVESSAFGSTGPWSKRMGYGPLVRAAAGLTKKWCYAGDAEGFCDAVTIYPDHVAARIGATTVLVLLIGRLRSGRGGHASISQAEVMLAHLATEIAGTALGIDSIEDPQDAPWGVFQAKGDDQWCVVTVTNDHEWLSLAQIIGRDDLAGDDALAQRTGRRANTVRLNAAIADWMATQGADAAMEMLQAAGVPAARMLRVAELPEFGYFKERGLFRTEPHPHLDDMLTLERFHVKSETIAEPAMRPAPLMGEHSIEVMREWLGLDDAEIDRLIDEQIVEPTNPTVMKFIEDRCAKESMK